MTVGEVRPFKITIKGLTASETTSQDASPPKASAKKASKSNKPLAPFNFKKLKLPAWFSSLIGFELSDLHASMYSLGVEILMEQIVLNSEYTKGDFEGNFRLHGLSIKALGNQNGESISPSSSSLHVAPDLLNIDNMEIFVNLIISNVALSVKEINIKFNKSICISIHPPSLEDILSKIKTESDLKLAKKKENPFNNETLNDGSKKKDFTKVGEFYEVFKIAPVKAFIQLDFDIRLYAGANPNDFTKCSFNCLLSMQSDRSSEESGASCLVKFSNVYVSNFLSVNFLEINAFLKFKSNCQALDTNTITCLNSFKVNLNIKSPEVRISATSLLIFKMLQTYNQNLFQKYFAKEKREVRPPRLSNDGGELLEPGSPNNNLSFSFLEGKLEINFFIMSTSISIQSPSSSMDNIGLKWEKLHITLDANFSSKKPYIYLLSCNSTVKLNQLVIGSDLKSRSSSSPSDVASSLQVSLNPVIKNELPFTSGGKVFSIKELIINFNGKSELESLVNVSLIDATATCERNALLSCGNIAVWLQSYAKENSPSSTSDPIAPEQLSIKSDIKEEKPKIKVWATVNIDNLIIFVSTNTKELQSIGLKFKNIQLTESEAKGALNELSIFIPEFRNVDEGRILSIKSVDFQEVIVDASTNKKTKKIDVQSIDLQWTPGFTWMAVLLADTFKSTVDEIKLALNLKTASSSSELPSPSNQSSPSTKTSSPTSKEKDTTKKEDPIDIHATIADISLNAKFTNETSMKMSFGSIKIKKHVSETIVVQCFAAGVHAVGQQRPIMFSDEFKVVVLPKSFSASYKNTISIEIESKPIIMHLSNKFELGKIQNDVLSVQKGLKTLLKQRNTKLNEPSKLVIKEDKQITLKVKINIEKIVASIEDNPQDGQYVEYYDLLTATWEGFTINLLKHWKEHNDESLLVKLVSLDSCKNTPVSHGFTELIGGGLNINVISFKVEVRNSIYPMCHIRYLTISGVAVLADLNPTPRSSSFWPVAFAMSPGMVNNSNLYDVTILKNSSPVKLYHDFEILASEVTAANGPQYDFIMNAIDDAIELALPAVTDHSPKVAFWDKMRYQAHGNLSINFSSVICRMCAAEIDQEDAIVVEFSACNIEYKTGIVEIKLINFNVKACMPESFAKITYETGDEAAPQIAKTLTREKYVSMPVFTTELIKMAVQMSWEAPKGNDHYVQLQVMPDSKDTFEYFRATKLNIDMDVKMSTNKISGGSHAYFCWPIIDFVHIVQELIAGESPAATAATKNKPKIGSILNNICVKFVSPSVEIMWWEKIACSKGVIVKVDALDLDGHFISINHNITPKTLSVLMTELNFALISRKNDSKLKGVMNDHLLWDLENPSSRFVDAKQINIYIGKNESFSPTSPRPTCFFKNLKLLYTVNVRNMIQDISRVMTNWKKEKVEDIKLADEESKQLRHSVSKPLTLENSVGEKKEESELATEVSSPKNRIRKKMIILNSIRTSRDSLGEITTPLSEESKTIEQIKRIIDPNDPNFVEGVWKDNQALQVNKMDGEFTEKYNIQFENVQINFHSPQTKSTVLLAIAKAGAVSRLFNVVKDNDRRENEFSLEGVDFYVNAKSEEDSPVSHVNWFINEKESACLEKIVSNSSLKILQVNLDDSAKEFDLPGLSVSIPTIMIRLRSHAMYQCMHIVKHVILAARKNTDDSEQPNGEKKKSNERHVLTSQVKGLIDSTSDHEHSGMIIDGKLSKNEKKLITLEANETLPLKKNLLSVNVIKFSSDLMKLVLCDEQGIDFSETILSRLLMKREVTEEGINFDCIHVGDLKVTNLNYNVHKDFANDLIFGVVNEGPESPTKKSKETEEKKSKESEEKLLILSLCSQSNVKLDKIGVPALNIYYYTAVGILQQKSKEHLLLGTKSKMCLQMSYNIFQKFNEYLFPDEVEEESASEEEEDSFKDGEPDDNVARPLFKFVKQKKITNLFTTDADSIDPSAGETSPENSEKSLKNLLPKKSISKKEISNTSFTKEVQSKNVNSTLALLQRGLGMQSAGPKCAHNFELDSNVKNCSICDKTIAYIRDPGYKCSLCKLHVHSACRNKALGLPEKQKKKITTQEIEFFKYVKLEHFTVVMSFKGFAHMIELEDFACDLKGFVINDKLRSWTELFADSRLIITHEIIALVPKLFKTIISQNNYWTLRSKKKEADASNDTSLSPVKANDEVKFEIEHTVKVTGTNSDKTKKLELMFGERVEKMAEKKKELNSFLTKVGEKISEKISDKMNNNKEITTKTIEKEDNEPVKTNVITTPPSENLNKSESKSLADDSLTQGATSKEKVKKEGFISHLFHHDKKETK